MTCIISVKDEDRLIFGADSCVSMYTGDDCEYFQIENPKKIVKFSTECDSTILFSLSGYLATINMAHEIAEKRILPAIKKPHHKYFLNNVLPIITEELNAEEDIIGTQNYIMVGIKTSLFKMAYGQYNWAEITDKCVVCGVGVPQIGKTVCNFIDTGSTPEQAIIAALGALSLSSPRVLPPFLIEYTR